MPEVSLENPVSTYVASNGLTVVDELKMTPAMKYNAAVAPMSDSFSSKLYVNHTKTFYASGFSIATFKGRWLCTFWRDGSVTIKKWDYFLVSINDGTATNKSTKIRSSWKPAKARGYVTLNARFFSGDVLWNVNVNSPSSVSSTVTDDGEKL